MTDHAVGGVDHFIYEESRQSADEQPERRSDNAVIEAFGETLWRGSRNAIGIKLICVAPDDLGNGGSRLFETSLLKRRDNGRDVIVQAALREADRRKGQDRDGIEQARRKKVFKKRAQ